METKKNARAGVVGRDARGNIKTGAETNPPFSQSFKQEFADLKSGALLGFALSPNTADKAAAATGAELIRLWRKRGLTADKLVAKLLIAREK